VEISIERVILRLETIRELSDVVFDLKPVVQILQKVSRQLYEVLPDVSTELNKVNDTITETLSVTRMNADEPLIPVNMKTPGGEEILKEVTNLLEEQVAEKLPEPPASLPEPTEEPARVREPESNIKRMVALAAVCSQSAGQETEISEDGEFSSQSLLSLKNIEVQKVSLTLERSRLEDIVFEYVKKQKGEIDLIRCSKELNIPCQEVKNALKSLGKKGKIMIKR